MACRGVHFAITQDDLDALRRAEENGDLFEVLEGIEERWEEGFVYETDKAWDAIHRCLTDGTTDFIEEEREPLGVCILNGEQFELPDYILSLITHDRLRTLVDRLAVITPQIMEERYWKLPADYARYMSKEDCEYMLECFAGLPAFLNHAEKAGRHVIFTVDQ